LHSCRCWRLIINIIEALVYIHRKGLAHGDVKDRNVLLDHEGCAKLTDFGNVQKVTVISTFVSSSGYIALITQHDRADDGLSISLAPGGRDVVRWSAFI